ncbi:A/G-specific adenine glycosylase [Fusibacter paucivorans]|uniref:Adenine DNA glycosylase n=1 Tax=Fusibacter paucivorans TaxID=76009 RepID=A0ABS5PS85_9FIRM|nr:A/G-specific adenine glycosylase [Fusibacter paucivorans]MBS7528029.1 A/G-specific adenine glycosylase [Fusibacter paucivorans]
MWVETLCQWYRENQRDLPWRHDRAPYHIWLSEIMLQQTQVATTIDYYQKFIEAFPTIQSLAEATEDDVLRLWQGLGYYTRARNLKRCADVVWQQHGGVFPDQYHDLLKLPGIGPYTAGAIASIAFDRRVPAVDGNVLRVYARLYALSDDIADPKTAKRFREKLTPLVPEESGVFNQALMELGAMVCTPQNPKCNQCPVSGCCKAYTDGMETAFPVKTKKIKQKHLTIGMGIIWHEDKLLCFKQVEGRLLHGLWSLPFVPDLVEENALRTQLAEDFQLVLSEGRSTGRVRHVFTHLIWDVHIFCFEAKDANLIDFPEVRWCSTDELEALALSTVIKKVLAKGINLLL